MIFLGVYTRRMTLPITRLFQRLIIDTLGMERFNPAVAAF